MSAHKPVSRSVPAIDTVSRPAERPKIEPLAPERYKVQFTVSRETYDKLRHVQDLLRHRVPGGDPAAIFDRALTLLLEHLKKQKFAVSGRPRATRSTTTRSRHVPAAIRRTVWARDGARCRFEGPAGRCGETGRLEFHHVVPYACGGRPWPTTCSFAAPHTIGMRRSSGLESLCAKNRFPMVHSPPDDTPFFGERIGLRPLDASLQPDQGSCAARSVIIRATRCMPDARFGSNAARIVSTSVAAPSPHNCTRCVRVVRRSDTGSNRH